MELGDLLFAPLQSHGFILQACRQVAGDHGDQKKEHKVDDVLRIADPKGDDGERQ